MHTHKAISDYDAWLETHNSLPNKYRLSHIMELPRRRDLEAHIAKSPPIPSSRTVAPRAKPLQSLLKRFLALLNA